MPFWLAMGLVRDPRRGHLSSLWSPWIPGSEFGDELANQTDRLPNNKDPVPVMRQSSRTVGIFWSGQKRKELSRLKTV